MLASLASFNDQLANMNSSQIQSKAQKFQAKHVVLCQDLLSSRRKLPCLVKNLPALQKTYQHAENSSSLACSPPSSESCRRKRLRQGHFASPCCCEPVTICDRFNTDVKSLRMLTSYPLW